MVEFDPVCVPVCEQPFPVKFAVFPYIKLFAQMLCGWQAVGSREMPPVPTLFDMFTMMLLLTVVKSLTPVAALDIRIPPRARLKLYIHGRE